MEMSGEIYKEEEAAFVKIVTSNCLRLTNLNGPLCRMGQVDYEHNFEMVLHHPPNKFIVISPIL